MTGNRYKKDFPIFKKNPNLIYLDSAATTLKPQVVIDEIVDYYTNYSTNIHRGVYSLAHIATEKYENARSVIASFIGAKPAEISFTSGATASLNMIAIMIARTLKKGDEVIVSELEHHSSLLPWLEIAREKSLIIKYIPLNEDNEITVENFKKVFTLKTKVVAITHMSNVLGNLTPIKQICEIAHRAEAFVVLDAAQSIAHVGIDVVNLDVDFMAFSGHKMLGPTGVGVTFGKIDILNSLQPAFYGGEMVNQVFHNSATYKDAPLREEAGSPPISGVLGLAKAVEYLQVVGMDEISRHEKELGKYLRNELSNIPEVTVYNPKSELGIITFNIKGVHPHDAATIYDKNEIAVRAGHHCAQLVNQVIEVPYTLRISLYLYNTVEDCQRFIESTKEVINFFNQI